MPIPAPPCGEVTASTAVVALFRQLHDELRALIESLDASGLNFVPCVGANSIATIVTHVVGSEAETLRCVAGIASVRDRDAEFRRGHQAVADVLAQLDSADELLDALAPALTAERLVTVVTLPTLPANETRPGITWLIGNLGHAREHVGHAFLTQQLYAAQS